jgi:hypothetical protein
MSIPAESATGAAPTAPLAAALPELHCENCGNAVTQRYCGACGQRLDSPVHSLWHFTQLATEDLTHADSRLWRTLGALLFRPGRLTREFLGGHRARYLPPLRLYLVVSVAFFLLASAFGNQRGLGVVRIDEKHPSAATMSVEGTDDVPEFQARPGETNEQRAARVCPQWSYDGPGARWLAPLMPQACRKILADQGHSLQEAFLHNIPRAMFLFLPLLAGIMMLLYWFPRHYYVQHLLLFVHNHAFVFLVGALLILLRRFGPHIPYLGGLVFCYLAWYMYRSMRIVYGQGRMLTLAKLSLLALCYLFLGALTIGITTAYSALSL